MALDFWRAEIRSKPAFRSRTESLWAITLDNERGLTGVHAVASKAFGDASRFADELFQSDYLRGVPEFLLIDYRPGAVLAASAADFERVRAVILAGRARKTELLDWLIVGKPDDVHLAGVFSFHRVRRFSAKIPFAKSSNKACEISAKAEAAE